MFAIFFLFEVICHTSLSFSLFWFCSTSPATRHQALSILFPHLRVRRKKMKGGGTKNQPSPAHLRVFTIKEYTKKWKLSPGRRYPDHKAKRRRLKKGELHEYQSERGSEKEEEKQKITFTFSSFSRFCASLARRCTLFCVCIDTPTSH